MSWKSRPSWYFVADEGSTVQPELQGFVAKRMGATVFETNGSRVPKLAQTDLVLYVIRKAATAVQLLRQRKVHRTCCNEPKGTLGDAKSEASLEASADFVRTYSAVVDALTATIMNAEAGLNWLRAQPPNLEEVRRTLNSIASDGKRAGAIAVRLHAPLKGSPQREDAVES
ncbi:hypothetical protein [Bradyrhizobium sp. USDA 4502]